MKKSALFKLLDFFSIVLFFFISDITQNMQVPITWELSDTQILFCRGQAHYRNPKYFFFNLKIIENFKTLSVS